MAEQQLVVPFVVPEYITVHLGAPQENARNVTVRFADYIKNVASSEIYPTWPESAIRANILAQISYALNRVYTEWYPSQGYNFDITSTTQYDQKFIENRDIFENIARIVDDIFNDYVVRQGSVNPYFTQYCNGTTSTCDGLSQWGTVTLAEQGMVPYEILQYYYGDDINIVFDAPVGPGVPSYPGIPLRRGDSGEDVRTIQRQLNRIGRNYPAIPQIPVTNGIFDFSTEAAVRAFQQIFNLAVDGIVGKATWYKIKYTYNAIKGLGELYGEGVSLSEVDRIFATELDEGDSGNQVRVVQYYLAVVSFFDPEIPQVYIDGEFDQNTVQGVKAFQSKYGLEPTGVVDRETWNRLTQVYQDTINSLPEEFAPRRNEIYPGRILTRGERGDDVLNLQRFINRAAGFDPAIPRLEEDGIFGPATEAAVRLIQEMEGIEVNGAVGPVTWSRIIALSRGDDSNMA